MKETTRKNRKEIIERLISNGFSMTRHSNDAWCGGRESVSFLIGNDLHLAFDMNDDEGFLWLYKSLPGKPLANITSMMFGTAPQLYEFTAEQLCSKIC